MQKYRSVEKLKGSFADYIEQMGSSKLHCTSGSFAEIRALLQKYKALLQKCRALFWIYTALFCSCRALQRVNRSLLHYMMFFFVYVMGSFVNVKGPFANICRALVWLLEAVLLKIQGKHCNPLQHTATHCNTRNTLQRTATRCNTQYM